MTIHVVVQNKPDELRPCRWRDRGTDDGWTEGFFHRFYDAHQDEGELPGVMLETSVGRLFLVQPVTALELQFTDREEIEGDVSEPMPCCPWQIGY